MIFNEERIIELKKNKKILNEYFKFLEREDLKELEIILEYVKFYNYEFIKEYNMNKDILKLIDNILIGVDVYREKAKVIMGKENMNITYILDEIRSSLKSNHNINDILILKLEKYSKKIK